MAQENTLELLKQAEFALQEAEKQLPEFKELANKATKLREDLRRQQVTVIRTLAQTCTVLGIDGCPYDDTLGWCVFDTNPNRFYVTKGGAGYTLEQCVTNGMFNWVTRELFDAIEKAIPKMQREAEKISVPSQRARELSSQLTQRLKTASSIRKA